MKLEIADPTALVLVNRLQKEIGELVVANAFLDEHCDAFVAELARKNNDISVLNDKLQAMDNALQERQNTINELHSELTKRKEIVS